MNELLLTLMKDIKNILNKLLNEKNNNENSFKWKY